jgi:hypothetical protein
MNTIIIIINLGIILIPVILVAVVISRLNRNQWRRVQEMLGQDTGFAGGFRNAMEADANVIRKDKTIVPNASGYAKVDLQFMVELPRKALYQVFTYWLVKVDSLNLILPGRNVPIKVDPQKTMRIIPNVSWARPWIFGE